ncbi:MAG TPA: hypothetical protein VLO10_05945 [Candidatus Deferrimicrobium sp.]|nr:hypothetical protein [Candidatus Deferrimicrobium sp.]
MAEHDPQAFSDLFASEPDPPGQGEVGEWLARYARLVDMLERQLEETKRFADSVPEAMRQYLETENGKILTEELAIFRDRLAHWRGMAETV